MRYGMFAFFIFFGAAAWAQPPTLSETLLQAESAAVGNSKLVKAAQENYSSAEDQAASGESALYPRLTLDGTYFYQTNVPQITVGPPGSPAFSFGDYNNYNIGPTLSYTLFDGGHARRQWRSTQEFAKAKMEDSKMTARQALLSTRMAYVKVQLSISNLLLTADSLKLSQSREHDVANRFKAGAASRLDAVNTKREVLSYQLRLRQAQNELGAAVRDLLALTAERQDADYSRPYPKVAKGDLPEGFDEPTIYLTFDPLDHSFKDQKTEGLRLDPKHPQIQSLEAAAEGSRRAADAQSSNLWPKIQLSARAMYQYPNGPILQTVQQNIFTVNLSMPLFEGSLNRSQVEQHSSEAAGFEYQREQRAIDMDRDWKKTADLLSSLRSEEKLSQENASEAAIAAKLTYQSYRAGKQEYLDVETANLRLLEAQVNAAQIQANILSTVAQMKFLSVQSNEGVTP